MVAAAYTSNFAGAASTTLYVIDRALGILAVLNPSVDGFLDTVGPLGATPQAASEVGFDIGASGVAYAAYAVGASQPTNLYRMDLATGTATLLGRLGTGAPLRGLAVVP